MARTKKEEVVDPIVIEIPKLEKITIIANAKARYLETGKEYTVSYALAKTLIDKGAATLKK